VGSKLRVLELFAGIGGCAAALRGAAAEVVAAVDINRSALEVYRHNFSHPIETCTIESLSASWFDNWQADLWWLSPPCQPYTRRGKQLDLEDPRSQALLTLLERIEQVQPNYIALENVPPFADSQARTRLGEILSRCGYEFAEQILCPTELGVPNRRRRYYLLAGKKPLGAPPRPEPQSAGVADYLDAEVDQSLDVSPELLQKYAGALDLVAVDDPAAVTACFTAAYGRSPVRSGSYLQTPSGVRRFSPAEILRLLGFPRDYHLPEALTPAKAWPLVGNSLSVVAVRHVLAQIEELALGRNRN